MRCTSSDLIIEWPPPLGIGDRGMSVSGLQATGSAPERKYPASSIVSRRVPKGQQTVKVETFDCLSESRHFDAARERPEPRPIKYRDRRHVQERKIAKPRFKFPVGYPGLRVDVFFLFEPL